MRSKRLLIVCLTLCMALLVIALPVLAAGDLIKSASNPVVFPTNTFEGNTVGACSVIRDVTTYKMWYSAIDDSGVPTIGYSTSNDGLVWDKSVTSPVVVGGTAAWDYYGVGAPSVILDGTTYKMWYTGLSEFLIPSIGYATSPDGIAWSGNVQVMNSASAWEAYGVSMPSVIKDGSSYKMWYTGHESDILPSAIGYATSVNGTSWTHYASNPVLDVDVMGWDSGAVFGCCVKKTGSDYLMYYSGWLSSGPRNPSIGKADSSDGIVWNRDADNPVLGAGGSADWDGRGVAMPSFLIVGANTKMWFTGADNTTPLPLFKIGYASTSSEEMPAGSNLSTAIMIAGFVVLMAAVSIWSIRRNRA